jgi:3-hydroxyisobutyrate dehydrogenase
MTAPPSHVGFVGLGSMGSALARRLAAANEMTLTVFDLDDSRCRELAAAGAVIAESPRDLAKVSDVVLTCLPTSQHVESVVFNESGLADGLAEGGLLVDCTSGHPRLTRAIGAKLAARGVAMVDAPVSGGPQGAEAGTIALLAGGTATDVARASTVLSLISPNVRHVGDLGAGHTVKLLNNVLAAGHRMLAFETAAVAAASGVDPRTFIEAVNISSGRSNATQVTMPRHGFGEHLDQGFSLGLMAKDVSQGCTLYGPELDEISLAQEVEARLRAAVNRFGPDVDINRTLQIYEEAVGRTVATSERDGA